MALKMLNATEMECIKLDSNFTRLQNEGYKILNIIMFIFRRIWSRFTENLAIVATFDEEVNEYADFLSQERLDVHFASYERLHGHLQNNPSFLDGAHNSRVRGAFETVQSMISTLSFLVDARLLAYILHTGNADRQRGNEVAHPSLETIRESMEDLNPDSEDFTDQAYVIFQAMDNPMSASNRLLTSATVLMTTTVLGRLR